ncbi:B12-binding domain-containing radical SAM protein [Candidatus Omnitrophota bacterium]
MRILFTNTYYQQNVEYTSLISVIPPLDIAYSASLVRERVSSAGISMLDANALRLKPDDEVKRIKEMEPDIAIFTAATHSINTAKHVINKVKNEKITTILIGSHASAFPEGTLSEIEGLDIAIVGEPEFTVLETVEAFIAKKPLLSIKGICYREGGAIRRTGEKPLLRDLDSLPPPARDLLPNDLYFSPYSHPVTAIQTTRGCPGRCSFCDSHLIFGGTLRKRKPKLVVDEMEGCLRSFGTKYFAITDHTFTADRSFVREVCGEIIKRNMGRRIRWACNTRVDMLNDELVSLMKRAGCLQIGIGIESGVNRALKSVKKGITEGQIKDAILRIKRHGILVMGYTIIGFPHDTRESIAETKRKIFEFNPHTLQLSFATPLPGSELHKYCVQTGRILSKNWDDYVFLRKSIIRNDTLSTEELVNLRQDIIRGFYLRPRKIAELLFFFIFRIRVNYLSSARGFFKVLSKLKK